MIRVVDLLNMQQEHKLDIGTPYLSFVVTTRNDDHGGNLHNRMQLFIQGLLEQCKRHKLDAELIIVEWNPPSDRAQIAQAYQWEPHDSPCKVRIVQVSHDLHRRIANSTKLPLFQMIAKNVGIRRACGKFILATNIDILFSNELITFLAAQKLSPRKLYRIDRYDVPSAIPTSVPLDAQLDYCREHILRIFERNGTYSFLDNTYHRVYPRHQWGSAGKVIHALGVGQRILTSASRRFVVDARYRAEILRWETHAKKLRSGHYHRQAKELFTYITTPQRERLHTNASGDFTLMSRQDWFDLRGYPELPVHAMHLDSLLCYMAFYAGLQENVLDDPLRIYHIEHAFGWTPESNRDGAYDQELIERGIPRIFDEELNHYAIQMKRLQSPLLQNSEAWGFAGENLVEHALCFT